MTGLLTDRLEPNRRLGALGIDAYPSSTGQVWGADFGSSWDMNPANVIAESITSAMPFPSDEQFELMARTSGRPVEELRAEIEAPLLTPEEANNRFGMGGQLKFDQPVSATTARRLQELKREELLRQSIIQRGRGGVIETVGGLGAGLLASALDPINIASAFIPVVGEAKYAVWAAKFGKSGARFAKGAAEGAIGAAVVEPIVLAGAQMRQADYTAADSLLNIAFGTALGGGLHMGVGWVGDKLAGRRPSPIAQAIDQAPLEVKEAALRGAIAAIAEGRPIDVGPLIEAAQPTRRQELRGGAAAVELTRARIAETPGAQRMTNLSPDEAYEAADSRYAPNSGKADDLDVGEDIANTGSISAELGDDYTVLKSVRTVPLSDFNSAPKDLFYAADDHRMVRALAETIKHNNRIDPLIVVIDDQGPYILEGAHRLGALHLLGKKEFPALVVIDDSQDSLTVGPNEGIAPTVPEEDMAVIREAAARSQRTESQRLADYLAEDREAAALIDDTVGETFKKPEVEQAADDVKTIEEEVADLDKLMKASLNENDLQSLKAANQTISELPRRARGIRAAAACFLGLT